ncbi:MAG: NfeD family protein [Photobacterium aquimaris]|nr:NfeD family protein [Photobacterium aquimaris]
MTYFFENHHHFWYLIAGLSFVIELSIMGLSGPLLFFAIASVITGILVTFGIIGGWQTEIFTLGVLTALIAIILWKPLKRLQQSHSKMDNSSDMIGLEVPVSVEVTETSGNIRYSGINWNARLMAKSHVKSIANGSQCKIVAVSGNTMLVEPV